MNTDNQNNLTEDDINNDIAEFEQSHQDEQGMNFDDYSPFRVETKGRDEISWENFLQKVSMLTDSLKNVLTSADTVEFLILIAEKFDLSDNQSASLSKIVRDVIFGDLFVGDMTNEVVSRLSVDVNIAQQIRAKIINELLAPVIEDIKKIQREKFPDRVGQGSADTIPRPPVNQSNVIDLRNQQ